MALDLNDLCPEGRRWLEDLPPCLDVDQVAAVLADAVTAWHDHQDQADDDATAWVVTADATAWVVTADGTATPVVPLVDASGEVAWVQR
jgi:hypothetical protein